MARRLILAPVLIPLMTGLLKAVGLGTGMHNVEVASWLFAFLNLFIFTLAIWWSASLLHRAEIVRSGAEADLQKAYTELERRVSERTAELSRAVTTMQESEARARLVLDTALDAVITMDSRGMVTSWNRQAEQTFGWSRQEIIGQSLASTIIPPRYREAHERGLKHFLATQEGPVLNKRIEITALHRSGREFPLELAITPIRLGDFFIFSAFVRDISERKRAEEAVRRTEDLYRRAITAANAVPYLSDYATSSYAFIGEGIQPLTGYSASEMTPQLWEELSRETIMRGEAKGLSAAEAVHRARSGQIKRWQSDCVITTRDGQRRWVADSSKCSDTTADASASRRSDPVASPRASRARTNTSVMLR